MTKTQSLESFTNELHNNLHSKYETTDYGQGLKALAANDKEKEQEEKV